jgi:hypothetical protein
MGKISADMCDKPAESQQNYLLTVAGVCFALQALSIVAKFVTRGVIQRKLWLDDWILLGAVVCNLLLLSFSIHVTDHVLARYLQSSALLF